MSMTIRYQDQDDLPYWNKLVDLLMKTDIDNVLKDPEVKSRCDKVIEENAAFGKHLTDYTEIINNISITDFRSLDTVPSGNRFLTYSLFPKSIASVKLRFDGPEQKHVRLSIGHSIFNKLCNVNIGNLLAQYGGGGHAGAGGCMLKADTADKTIKEILEIMFQNKKES